MFFVIKISFLDFFELYFIFFKRFFCEIFLLIFLDNFKYWLLKYLFFIGKILLDLLVINLR